MSKIEMVDLFLGYGDDKALTIKYQKAIPMLEAMGGERVEVDGDICHRFPKSKMSEVQTEIERLNEKYHCNLVADWNQVK